MTKIIRLPGVLEVTGISRPQVYRLMRLGEFPRPISIGARAVGWRVADVEAWLESRPIAGSWYRP